MIKDLQEIKETLKEYNQEHLLKFYDELSKENKEKLLNQLKNINFEKMRTLYEDSKKDEILDNRFSPIEYIIKGELDKEKIKEYTKIGEECVKNNEVAIVTMAGGQGSRLGISGPKGAYEIDANESRKSLFEIIYDNIKRVNVRYEVEPYWLIMTSKENDKQTKEFFERRNYFNYNKDKIIFFKQNKNPILDIQGRLVLENKYTIKEASNGNGDVFKAMERNKLISILKENGVKYISFGRS